MARQEHEVASQDASVTNNFHVAAPQISMPKGGGAIRGIGEKFSVNPVTGTGAMSVPIFTSPGRAGFGPRLTLEYDSGAGNGPFGIGWRLSIPSISRKTDKGLPRYYDAEDSDVFVLSGAEDLVPVLVSQAGEWRRDRMEAPSFAPQFDIDRYRPRTEGLFARIERWTDRTTGDAHWRSISRDNVTSVYGRDAQARIADPDDPTRVFSWLICETFDDRGNALRYEYKAEDAANVDIHAPQERNRLLGGRYAQRYLKRVRYANRTPRLDGEDLAQRTDWLLEALFDYGEHDAEVPSNAELRTWPCRADPFSSYRAAFEVRTQRLCRRVVMLHHFPEELGGVTDYPVRSTDFTYTEGAVASFLSAATQSGYARQPNGDWVRRSLPKLEFGYSEARIDDTVRELEGTSVEHLPQGLCGPDYQWIDLDGEGVSGVLSEQAGEWRYKRSLGGGALGATELVARKPAAVALARGQQQLMDLAGEGRLELVEFGGPHAGFSRRGDDGSWRAFEPFRARANIDTRERNLRFIDLTGDGRPDILVSEDTVFTWHESLAREGFAPGRRTPKPRDEARGARLLFSDSTETILLADMSGDGLTDLVRIRHGDVCYWPNLGYGRFGSKVTMANAPRLDDEGAFDPRRVRLADIDGSGVCDIVYAGSRGVTLCFNQSGNSWSAPRALPRFPRVDGLCEFDTVDLLGNGTACLVWSTPSSVDARRPMRYVDLMGGAKPHLLTRVTNNLGAVTTMTYASSARFYLEDRRAGRPWATKLPFPVHVLERVEVRDLVSDTRLVSTYRYRHGYFDSAEREFRGFAYVEQRDAEAVVGRFDLPPVVTKTWYHTGAWLEGSTLEAYFKDPKNGEYFTGDPQAVFLPDTVIPEGLTADEMREAARAMKGSILRQEVYAEDGTEKQALPYSVAERSYRLRRLQPRARQRYTVFLTHSSESLRFDYERVVTDPRVAHELTLAVDDFGNVLESLSLNYARRAPQFDEQAFVAAVFTRARFTNAVMEPLAYRAPAIWEKSDHELTFPALVGSSPLAFDACVDLISAASEIPYDAAAPAGSTQLRLIERHRTLYRRDDLGATLPAGELESMGLVAESYRQALTAGLLDLFSPWMPRAQLASLLTGPECGYRDLDNGGGLWIGSGRTFFSANPVDAATQELQRARASFFQPQRVRDAFGNDVVASYEKKYSLTLALVRDAVGNEVRAEHDFRTLLPRLITDANDNRSEARYDVFARLIATAVRGKASGAVEGDSFDEFEVEPDAARVASFFASDDPSAAAAQLLGTATTRVLHDLEHVPACAATLARETHVGDSAAANPPQMLMTFVYSDGFHREAQRKMQAESGALDPEDPTSPVLPRRWVSTGTVVYNSKDKPVRKFEAYFSATPQFGTEERGVSDTLIYDARGRLVAILHPNHSFDKVIYGAWQHVAWDANDTALMNPAADADVGHLLRLMPPSEYLPTWHERRISGAEGASAKVAAEKTAAHAGTPATMHVDVRGREFLSVFDAGPGPDGAERKHRLRRVHDVEGNLRAVIDALDRVVMRYDYDMVGQRLHQSSLEAGERWTLYDCTTHPVRLWNSRRFALRMEYDALRRPVRSFVQGGDSSDPGAAIGERLTELTVYGDDAASGLNLAQQKQANVRGKALRQHDSAGVTTFERYDFKGNCLRHTRRLLRDAVAPPDWSQSPELETEGFTTSNEFDALNRTTTTRTPDGSAFRATFNEANLLERVDVQLRGAASGGQPVWTPFVASIDYDARGQRLAIEYGNGVATQYRYEPATFRLAAMRTSRSTREGVLSRLLGSGAAFGSQILQNTGLLQDLSYTYDAVGNLVAVVDGALRTVFNNNQQIDAACRYTHDALYRLIEATGREHRTQTAFAPAGAGARDYPFAGPAAGEDLQALRNYVERYEYDAAGNILRLDHDASNAAWRRTYQYTEPSQTETGSTSNRLSSVISGGSAGTPPESFRYDAHGNTIEAGHLSKLVWNHCDQLVATARQVVGTTSAATTHYVYGITGERVRKVTLRAKGTRASERLYLGGYEVHREYQEDGVTIERTRESLHVLDGRRRIAVVETLLVDGAAAISSPRPLSRYQIGNHLGSSTLELDADGALISYEEYSPFGATSFQAGRSAAEVSLKRYRHTGRERDSESGFAYHGSRYYAPWLGRWMSCDPLFLVEGANLYRYCRNAPLQRVDPSGTNSSAAAAEGSVLTGTVDPMLAQKDIGYNTEITLEIKLKDGTTVTRRIDRFFQDPNTGDWTGLEAKGRSPGDLTANERAIDKKLQQQGGTFRVIYSAGNPPPGHGQFHIDIPFTRDFTGELKPGRLMYVHGNATYQATATDPYMVSAAVWAKAMDLSFKNVSSHEGLIRKINANAAPTWITFEQFRAEYKQNTGREFPTSASVAKANVTVQRKDWFLNWNQPGGISWKQMAAATAVAGVVVTSPVWVPILIRATPAAAETAGQANYVRIAIEEVGGVRVRIAEQEALEYIGHLGEEGVKEGTKAVLNLP